jgi:Icc-related predicted phosphoesterase
MQSIIHANPDADVLVIGGDVTTYGSHEEMTAAINQAMQWGKPIVAVCGNMDPPELEGSLDSIGVSINGRGVIINDMGFFGVSACPFSPLHTPNEISEEKILQLAESGWKGVAGAKWKVFVPHCPPVNTKLDRIHSGKNVGSISVRTLIEKCQPDVTICGHIHESRGTDLIGKTQIVNCGPAGQGYYAVIQLADRTEIQLRQ